jgi:hypothetical protein
MAPVDTAVRALPALTAAPQRDVKAVAGTLTIAAVFAIVRFVDR